MKADICKCISRLICLVVIALSLPAIPLIAHANELSTEQWAKVGTCEWRIGDEGDFHLRPLEGVGEAYLYVNDDYYRFFPPWQEHKDIIISIEFEGPFAIYRDETRFYVDGMFKDLEKLEQVKGLSNLGFLPTADIFGGMFSGCSALVEVDLSGIYVDGVEDMSSMFSGCSSLISVDFSGCEIKLEADYRSQEGLYGMFVDCSSLRTVDLSGIDSSNTKNFSGMFSGCSAMESLDLSCLNTSAATDFGYMFHGCVSLVALNISSFDTSLARDMDGMFRDCSSLAALDVTHFDTSDVWSMCFMFQDCSSLVELDVRNFDIGSLHSNGGAMHSMFEGCSSLQSLDLSGFVTQSGMLQTYLSGTESGGVVRAFAGCTSLRELNLTNFDLILEESNYYGNQIPSLDLFQGCVSLEKIIVGDSVDYRDWLPEPSSEFIAGATGFWYDEIGRRFAGTDIPNGCPGVYYAVSPTLGKPPYDIAGASVYLDGILSSVHPGFSFKGAKIEPDVRVCYPASRNEMSSDRIFASVPLMTGYPLIARNYEIAEFDLIPDIDYTISLVNNEHPGTAQLTLRGEGSFTGEKRVPFEIRDINETPQQPDDSDSSFDETGSGHPSQQPDGPSSGIGDGLVGSGGGVDGAPLGTPQSSGSFAIVQPSLDAVGGSDTTASALTADMSKGGTSLVTTGSPTAGSSTAGKTGLVQTGDAIGYGAALLAVVAAVVAVAMARRRTANAAAATAAPAMSVPVLVPQALRVPVPSAPLSKKPQLSRMLGSFGAKPSASTGVEPSVTLSPKMTCDVICSLDDIFKQGKAKRR